MCFADADYLKRLVQSFYRWYISMLLGSKSTRKEYATFFQKFSWWGLDQKPDFSSSIVLQYFHLVDAILELKRSFDVIRVESSSLWNMHVVLEVW